MAGLATLTYAHFLVNVALHQVQQLLILRNDHSRRYHVRLHKFQKVVLQMQELVHCNLQFNFDI